MPARRYRFTATIPETATLAQRAVAFLLDVALVGVLFVAAVLLASVILAAAPARPSAAPRDVLAVGLLFLPFLLVYFTAFEAGLGRTPGKAMVGLRVQRLDGGKPSVLDAFVRNLLRLLWLPPGLNVVFLAADLWLIARTEMEQRIGDLAADTIVVVR